MIRIAALVLLSSTAAMAEGKWAGGAPPVFGVRPADAPPMVMVAPSSLPPEEKHPICHRVRRGLSTCEGGHSVTDLDGITTFYSADMMRVLGTIQITGAVKP